MRMVEEGIQQKTVLDVWVDSNLPDERSVSGRFHHMQAGVAGITFTTTSQVQEAIKQSKNNNSQKVWLPNKRYVTKPGGNLNRLKINIF